MPVGGQRTSKDFSGGEDSTCVRVLRELGFDVVPKVGAGRAAELRSYAFTTTT